MIHHFLPQFTERMLQINGVSRKARKGRKEILKLDLLSSVIPVQKGNPILMHL